MAAPMHRILNTAMGRIRDSGAEGGFRRLATDGRRLDDVSGSDGNAFWLMFGAVLVFFMQTGFAMLEVGCVSIKNTKNILVKNVFDASIGAMCWYVCGFAFALGGGDPEGLVGAIGGPGSSGFMLKETGLYDKAMWLFQWAFAATAATIVSGAVAERVSMGCYLVYSICLTAFIYPAVVYAGWGYGFASAWREDDLFGDCGVIDFAGSGVVHLTGGVAALVACIVIGKREELKAGGVPKQQSVSHQTLGTLILWFGWYGFNGVSTLAITAYGGVAAHTMVTTTLAAAAGCLACATVNYLIDHAIEPSMCNNGILGGLVSITAPCSTCAPYAAIIIGAIGGVLVYFSLKFLPKIGVDDVVGAIPVHGVCGIWGVIAAALFATPYYYGQAYYADRKEDCAGIFYGGNGGSLGAAIAFLIFVIVWVGATSAVMFLACKATIGVRVAKEVEEEGMDSSKHGGAVDYYSPVEGAAAPSKAVAPV